MQRKFQLRLIVGLVVLSVFFVAVASAKEFTTYDEWLQWAEMGPYQPEVEDWDAIYEAAKDEPSLLIYSGTSRIHPAMTKMMEKYPGVTVESINLSAVELNERAVREWDAGIREVGIVHSGGPEVYYNMLLDRNSVTNYVPRHLQEKMDPAETTPLLRHRYHGCVPIYSTNIEDPDTTPWSNIWELTTEEWYGKVATWDPLETDNTRDYFATLIQYSDEMAVLYEEYFGKEIELTAPNAGLEFIKRLLDNGLRIFSDHRDVAHAVTAADGNFAGFTTSSAYRLVIDGTYDFKIDTDVSPIFVGHSTLVVGSFTSSPNTAKLAVNWLMSEEGGSEWWGPNFPPYSSGIEPPGQWLTLNEFKYRWELSLEKGQELTDMLIDYWMLWR